MRFHLVLIAICASACGGVGSPVGTWLSSELALSSGGTASIVNDFLIDGGGWRVGGGCVAPLVFSGAVALLETANWTCLLQSAANLPFLEDYMWKSGDVLLVKNARFEVLPTERLQIDFSLQVRNDPTNSTLGRFVEVTSPPGTGAERVK